MGKILNFSKTATDNPFSEEDFYRLNLEKLLNRSSRLMRKIEKLRNSEIVKLKNEKEFRVFIEGILSREIVKRKNISSEYFFCGNYISQLLVSLLRSSPEFWVVFDYEKKYSETGEPEYLREGANVCFLICTIFKERATWRLMPPSFYCEKGKQMYYQFYLVNQKEVSYHMSHNFEELADITRNAITGS